MSADVLEDHALLYDSGGITPKFENRIISKNIIFFYIVMLACVLLLAYVEYRMNRYHDFLRDSIVLYWVLSGIFFVFISSFRFKLSKHICRDFKIYTNGLLLGEYFYPWNRLDYITEVGVDFHQGEIATVQSQDHGIVYDVKPLEDYEAIKIWVPTDAVFKLDKQRQWKRQIVLGRTKKIEQGEISLDKPIYSHHAIEKVVLKHYMTTVVMLLLIVVFVMIITGALDEAFGLGGYAKFAPMALIAIVMIILSFHVSRIRGERLRVVKST